MRKIVAIILFISNIFLTAAFFGSSCSSSSSVALGEKAFHERQRKELLSGKITNMLIVLEPLFKNETQSSLKTWFRLLVHPKISSKKFYHAAAILYLDNGNDVLIEYGNYVGEKSNGFFSHFIGARGDKHNYKNKYHYLNEDGLRFIKLEIKESSHKFAYDLFSGNAVYCNVLVSNKTLGHLLDDFKEGWRAKNYIIGIHDCQAFVVKLIYKLKAVRSPGIERLRTTEKFIMTNDMMNAFYYTEKDIDNFLGRIPIFGLAYDATQFSIYYLEQTNIYNETKNKLKSVSSKIKNFFSCNVGDYFFRKN